MWQPTNKILLRVLYNIRAQEQGPSKSAAIIKSDAQRRRVVIQWSLEDLRRPAIWEVAVGFFVTYDIRFYRQLVYFEDHAGFLRACDVA